MTPQEMYNRLQDRVATLSAELNSADVVLGKISNQDYIALVREHSIAEGQLKDMEYSFNHAARTKGA